VINSLISNENDDSQDIQIGKVLSPKMESKEFNEFKGL